MGLRSQLVGALSGIARGSRAAALAIKRAALAIKDHPSHVLAAGWIAGMATFSVVTVQRARAAMTAEAAADASTGSGKKKASGEPAMTVAMLDIDQMEKLEAQRMHANGLAAAGEADPPTQSQMDDARTELAKGIEVDGEEAGVAGNIRIVAKGGLAGWIKRNKSKKPDPETLAWLRGEEAKEGGAAYAGWIGSNGEGDIMTWATDKKRRGELGSGTGDVALGSDLEPIATESPATPGKSPATPAEGSAAATPTTAGGEPITRTAEPSVHAGSGSAAEVASAEPATAKPTNAEPATAAIDLRVLGTAAAQALAPKPVAAALPEPSAEERARLLGALETKLGSDAPGVILRDHHLVVLLLADRLYAKGELTGEGKRVVREVARVLAHMPDRSFVIGADAETAMETAAYLMMTGVAEERMAIRVKAMDPAINLVEIDIVATPAGGLAHAKPSK